MKKPFMITFVISFVLAMAIINWPSKSDRQSTPTTQSWWLVQSIDTMKYSRDVSREKRKDTSFDSIIDTQVKNIADTGATHVAIATPYDEEFNQMMSRWVSAARKYKLNVWFRGNFSGWEKWFGYERIGRDEHLQKTVTFIRSHPDLFVDGDIFTACPECENGGPGDPRQTGDVEGFRSFMISERNAVITEFSKIKKKITTNYNSMNYDVASLVMDPQTTSSMGGVVAIDHYVESPKKLLDDVRKLSARSGGKVFLGEFGAPIPDIHGNMNDEKQADWIDASLFYLSTEPSLIGINYWVNVGGSTELWINTTTPKAAVAKIRKYFKPKLLNGTVFDQNNRPIRNASISTMYQNTVTDASGRFTLPILPNDSTLYIKGNDYPDMKTQITDTGTSMNIIIQKNDHSPLKSVLDYLNNLFK